MVVVGFVVLVVFVGFEFGVEFVESNIIAIDEAITMTTIIDPAIMSFRDVIDIRKVLS